MSIHQFQMTFFCLRLGILMSQGSLLFSLLAQFQLFSFFRLSFPLQRTCFQCYLDQIIPKTILRFCQHCQSHDQVQCLQRHQRTYFFNDHHLQRTYLNCFHALHLQIRKTFCFDYFYNQTQEIFGFNPKQNINLLNCISLMFPHYQAMNLMMFIFQFSLNIFSLEIFQESQWIFISKKKIQMIQMYSQFVQGVNNVFDIQNNIFQ